MKVKHKAKQTLVDLYHYDALFAKYISKINDCQQLEELDFNAYQMNKDFNKMFDLYVTYN